jgi:hypothetical protein
MANGERVRSVPGGPGDRKVNAAAAPCACGRDAVCEKGGRTVCRDCAELLTGREFPLRSGRQRCTFGSFVERNQLDMIDGVSTPRFYGRYIG